MKINPLKKLEALGQSESRGERGSVATSAGEHAAGERDGDQQRGAHLGQQWWGAGGGDDEHGGHQRSSVHVEQERAEHHPGRTIADVHDQLVGDGR